MTLSAKVANNFWVDVITTVAYLINKCPSIALEMKILEEV